MIKKLIFTAALLVPSLAYGQNPSADLSVQVTPAGSGPPNSITCAIGPNYTGSIPAQASAAGYTTCAANYDFTNASVYNNANMSTWLSCPDSGNAGFQFYCTRPGSSVFPPLSDFQIVTDTVSGPTGSFQALQIMFTPADQASGVGGTQMTTWTAVCPSGCPGSYFPSGNYAEYVARNPASTFNNPATYIGGAPYFANPNVTNWLEVDISEMYNPQNNNGAGAGEHCVGNFSCGSGQFPFFPAVAQFSGYNPEVYHAFGFRFTLDTSGNIGACTYYDAVQTPTSGRPACATTTYRNGSTDSAITARNGLVGAYIVPQGLTQTLTNPLTVLLQRVTIWTCASWRTTPCQTGVDVGTP
jgi:hypothetical protein